MGRRREGEAGDKAGEGERLVHGKGGEALKAQKSRAPKGVAA
jgi:hypothetical protein